MQAIGIPKQWTPMVTGDDIVCALLKGRGVVFPAGVAPRIENKLYRK